MGGCRGRAGESRGRGPVLGKRRKKTLTIVVSVIISTPQLVDFASSAFISKLRIICFTRLQRNVSPRVNCVHVSVCAYLLDDCNQCLCLLRGTAKQIELPVRGARTAINSSFFFFLTHKLWTIWTLQGKRAEMTWTLCL